MKVSTITGLRRGLAEALVLVLMLAGVEQGVVALSGPADAGFPVPGVHVAICHSGGAPPPAPAGPALPYTHSCCDVCALLAPVILPAPQVLSGPAPAAYFAGRALGAAWLPAVARLRTPRQSQGPPLA